VPAGIDDDVVPCKIAGIRGGATSTQVGVRPVEQERFV
jgi:hypothetical protein